MDSLSSQIIAGILVSLFSLFIGVLINERFFSDRSILPLPPKATKHSYAHLNGKWESYHITHDSSLHSGSFWLHTEIQLKISKNHILEGKITEKHPTSPLDYELRGEIRGGRVIMIANCVQDPSDFFTYIFFNVYSRSTLIGIWSGSDWQRKFTIASVIFSRSELNADELNKLLSIIELPNIEKEGSDVLINA
jgi:hypothetical protein